MLVSARGKLSTFDQHTKVLCWEHREYGHHFQVWKLPSPGPSKGRRYHLWDNGEPAYGGQWHYDLESAIERAKFCLECSYNGRIRFLEQRVQKLEGELHNCKTEETMAQKMNTKNSVEICDGERTYRYGELRPGTVFKRPNGNCVYMKTDRNNDYAGRTRTALSLNSGTLNALDDDQPVNIVQKGQTVAITVNR
jgi:hypothetical protein